MRPLSSTSNSSRRRKRTSGLPAAAIFIIVLTICGALTYLHKGYETTDSGGAPTSPLRQYLLAPAAKSIFAIHSWLSTNIASVSRGPKLAKQNAALQAQVAALTEQNRELSQQAAENIRLRTLLGFKTHAPYSLLPAEVIAIKPTPVRDTVTLLCGAHNGVTRLMPVISSKGALVGQVVSVTYSTSDVLLLTDDESSAGAMIYPVEPGDKLSEGICRGEHSSALNLIDLPSDADTFKGENVYTSGAGGVYPKGILIGNIQSSTIDPAIGLRSANVQPVVDFDHLQEVFVILNSPMQEVNPYGLSPESSAR